MPIVGRAMVTIAIAAVLLAGCGDGDENSSTGSSSQQDKTVTIEGQTANDHGTTDASGKTELAVELDDDYFEPTVIEGAPGQKLRLELENQGKRAHTFTVETQNVDVTVEAGQKGEATVTIPQSGTKLFTCTFHAGMGMNGGLRAKS